MPLLALPDPAAQRHAAREIIARALSVREAESLVKRLTMPSPPPRPDTARPEGDVHTRAAEDRMRFALGTKVRIVRRGHGGTIHIEFGSESELNRLYERLTETR